MAFSSFDKQALMAKINPQILQLAGSDSADSIEDREQLLAAEIIRLDKQIRILIRDHKN